MSLTLLIRRRMIQVVRPRNTSIAMTKQRLLFCLCVLMMILIAWLAPGIAERLRVAAIRQTIRLTDATSMRVNDAYVYLPDSTHELLRVHVTYEGTDPNLGNDMRAEIARSAEDTTFNHLRHWQVGLPDSKMDKLWEFQDFPRNRHPIFIRIYIRPKTGGKELVRVFEIPDRFNFIRNG